MKKTLRKLDSKWGMTLAICVTIVVSSVATATAGSLINGKNIKKGTVASKQIKNGTIVKADLSKKLSVAGPQGPQGVPGAAGATNVIARRFVEAVSCERAPPLIATFSVQRASISSVAAPRWSRRAATTRSMQRSRAALQRTPRETLRPDLSVATGWTACRQEPSGIQPRLPRVRRLRQAVATSHISLEPENARPSRRAFFLRD